MRVLQVVKGVFRRLTKEKRDALRDLWEEEIQDHHHYYYTLGDRIRSLTTYHTTPNTSAENKGWVIFHEDTERVLANEDTPYIIPIPIARDEEKRIIIEDMTKQPHLLIAGMTGSGKSTGIHNIIYSLFKYNHPSYLNITLVDPKGVSFDKYQKIAYVAKTNREINKCLDDAIFRMNTIYNTLRTRGFENITNHNNFAAKHKVYKLIKYEVIIFDEFADFSYQDSEGMKKVILLAQKARAAGIHLILATQRPSREVVTGLIKANFFSRCVFRVINQTNSLVALDTSGAEDLKGAGEMLWRGAKHNSLIKGRCPNICSRTMKIAIKRTLKMVGTFRKKLKKMPKKRNPRKKKERKK